MIVNVNDYFFFFSRQQTTYYINAVTYPSHAQCGHMFFFFREKFFFFSREVFFFFFREKFFFSREGLLFLCLCPVFLSLSKFKSIDLCWEATVKIGQIDFMEAEGRVESFE